MSLLITMQMHLDGPGREKIAGCMSEAMGQFIESIGKPNMADWTEEDWNNLVDVALDTAAVGVFQARIHVSEPVSVGDDTVEVPLT